MKKKIVALILALVCALCCAFGMTACGGGNDWVNGTVQTPEHAVNMALIGDSVLDNNMSETERTYLADRNVEFEIWLVLEQGYAIGSLKMYINGEETELTLDTRPNAHKNGISYICKYTPIADFTITFSGTAEPDTPIGRTLVLTDLTAYVEEYGERQPVPDDEVMAIAENLKENNLGKTAICDNDGKVTGTCNFGFGAFGELKGDEALTLTFDAQQWTAEIANTDGLCLSGSYYNETLTLYMQQSTDGDTPIQYIIEFVFTVQKAN